MAFTIDISKTSHDKFTTQKKKFYSSNVKWRQRIKSTHTRINTKLL